MNPELVLEIEAAAKGFGPNCPWYRSEDWGNDEDSAFIALCSPTNILALITEMCRREGVDAENARLRESLTVADRLLAGMWSYNDAGRDSMGHTWPVQASNVIRAALGGAK